MGNSRGVFSSTIEEKLIKENRGKKISIKIQHINQPDTILPHQNPHFSLKKSSEQSSNSHISTGQYNPFPLQNLQRSKSQHLPFKSRYLLAPSPTLKHHDREPGASDLSGDTFNPSILSKTIFKMNYIFLIEKNCFLPCSTELPFGLQALDTVVLGLPELGPHGEVI